LLSLSTVVQLDITKPIAELLVLTTAKLNKRQNPTGRSRARFRKGGLPAKYRLVNEQRVAAKRQTTTPRSIDSKVK